MKKDALLDALKSSSMTFTVNEIQEMMDDELNKDPKDMDAEIVDICAQILHKEYYNTEDTISKNKPKKGHIRSKTVKRIVFIAAVLLIVFSIGIPVYARYVHNNASDEIVRFFEDHFRFDLRNGLQDANVSNDPPIDIVSELQEIGLTDMILPRALLSEVYSVEQVQDMSEDDFRRIIISFKSMNTDVFGHISIMVFKNAEVQNLFQQGEVGENYDHVEQLQVDGINILVFGDNDDSFIVYANENTKYEIMLDNCDFDAALSIGKTIRS